MASSLVQFGEELVIVRKRCGYHNVRARARIKALEERFDDNVIIYGTFFLIFSVANKPTELQKSIMVLVPP